MMGTGAADGLNAQRPLRSDKTVDPEQFTEKLSEVNPRTGRDIYDLSTNV